MQTIKVIRQFVFNAPTNAGPITTADLLGDPKMREEVQRRVFTVGMHEIDDETANHPWIKAGADGSIEGWPKDA